VSDDSAVSADGGSVCASLVVDGSSVVGAGTTEVVEGNGSVVSGKSFGLSSLTVKVSCVSVDSDGTSHLVVGDSAFSGGLDAFVVGPAVHVKIVSSFVEAVFHPVDASLNVSPGEGPLATPVSVASQFCPFICLRSLEEFHRELVEVHGLSLGMEGLHHQGPSILMLSDSSLVSSGYEFEGSVPSSEDSAGDSSMVLGTEVTVGLDVSSFDELHVLGEVSHAGSLGLLEGSHVVEEGVVAKGASGCGGGGQDGGGEGRNESELCEH